MKKVCPECDHINDYENTVCCRCGCELDVAVKYKICPNCGKRFDNMTVDKCDECSFDLMVRGRPAARIFDEGQKSEIPWWLRVLCLVLPVIGIVIAVVFTITRGEDGKLQPETSKTFILTTVFGQIILIGIVVIISMLLSGNSLSIMKQYAGDIVGK